MKLSYISLLSSVFYLYSVHDGNIRPGFTGNRDICKKKHFFGIKTGVFALKLFAIIK